MRDTTGHKSGHTPGLTWGEYLQLLVEEHGTLTQVAWKLIEHGDDVANLERDLLRLRTRGQRDGGAWGQRLLRAFGVPQSIVARVRWLGLYHSPFSDLPLSLCLDQLRLWDRPPLVNSRARVWLHLGFASTALRQRRFADAASQLGRAEALANDADARLEAALQGAYLASRDDTTQVAPLLERAEALLPAIATIDDRACFAARLVDQRAFALNRAQDYSTALALYRTLPATDTHPFASYRRDAGIAYGLWRTGDRPQAIVHATRAIAHAGDGGYLRLRAMGLLMLARVADDAGALARAEAIARRLDDAELASRVARAREHRT